MLVEFVSTEKHQAAAILLTCFSCIRRSHMLDVLCLSKLQVQLLHLLDIVVL